MELSTYNSSAPKSFPTQPSNFRPAKSCEGGSSRDHCVGRFRQDGEHSGNQAGNNPGGRPKNTPLNDALRKLIESKYSLKIKPDDNATKAAEYLLQLIASGKVSAFKERPTAFEGTVKQKVVYVGGEQEKGGRPVVVRVEYAREETPET
jgi:hypothetical protein